MKTTHILAMSKVDCLVLGITVLGLLFECLTRACCSDVQHVHVYPFGHAAEFGLIIGLNVLSSLELDCSLFNLILF